MSQRIDQLQAAVSQRFAHQVIDLTVSFGELTLTVSAQDYLSVCRVLQSDEQFQFEQLIDLCGVDYAHYKEGQESVFTAKPRFAVVLHLLSIANNWRLRVRVFAPDDDMPIVQSVSAIWSSAQWFEREAFDLFGIIFDGHEDLRRLLTDYGFVGHPFRKDFPVTGHVEMRYDAEQSRVIYQPVTVEMREITPKIVREEHYGSTH